MYGSKRFSFRTLKELRRCLLRQAFESSTPNCARVDLGHTSNLFSGDAIRKCKTIFHSIQVHLTQLIRIDTTNEAEAQAIRPWLSKLLQAMISTRKAPDPTADLAPCPFCLWVIDLRNRQEKVRHPWRCRQHGKCHIKFQTVGFTSQTGQERIHQPRCIKVEHAKNTSTSLQGELHHWNPASLLATASMLVASIQVDLSSLKSRFLSWHVPLATILQLLNWSIKYFCITISITETKTCRWGTRFEEVHPFSAPGQQQLFHREENHRSWWLQHPRVKTWELRKRHEPLLTYAHVQIYENSLRARDTLRSLDFHPSVCCSLLFMRQTNKQININKPQKGHVLKIHVTNKHESSSPGEYGVSQGTSPSPCNSRNWANPPGRSGRSDLASVSPDTFTRWLGCHVLCLFWNLGNVLDMLQLLQFRPEAAAPAPTALRRAWDSEESRWLELLDIIGIYFKAFWVHDSCDASEQGCTYGASLHMNSQEHQGVESKFRAQPFEVQPLGNSESQLLTFHPLIDFRSFSILFICFPLGCCIALSHQLQPRFGQLALHVRHSTCKHALQKSRSRDGESLRTFSSPKF